MIPRILTLTAVLLASAELSGCYNYHALVPEHNIPTGTVIKDSDFRTECASLFHPTVDLAEDRSRVVGHKTLKPLNGGTWFHYSDVQSMKRLYPNDLSSQLLP